MNLENLDRLGTTLAEQRLNAVLLSSPASVTWLSGYAPPIQTGPNPFEGGPALAWVCQGGVVLILSDTEAGAARSAEAEVQEYLSYTIDGPAAGFDRQAAALAKTLAPFRSLAGEIAVELHTLPASLLEVLRESLPSVRFRPFDGQLDRLRAVKTAVEIESLRSALALCDLAQAETKRLLHPGKTEIEIWGEVKASLEIAACGRLPVLADFVAGLRTAEIGGLPGKYVLQAGDPLIADIVPHLNGYWGDNAGVHFAGEPNAELRKMYRLALDTLRRGIAAVKPGIRSCDLDALMRKSIDQAGYPVYPHHSGHGLGASYHEEPRIVPYNPLPLAPGMVIALEPGVYVPDVGGVRLEDVLLVTPDGCKLLTHHLDQE
jgi:Xaa-Pro aminopeptidase